MRIISSILPTLVLSVSTFVAGSTANPITFTFTGSGSGSIGGSAFGSSDFTITEIGNTADVQSLASALFIDDISASIDISGVGTFDILTATRTFINGDIVGYSRAGVDGSDLYDGTSSLLFGWDMLTSIGPITTDFDLFQWEVSPVIITDAGQLLFNNSEGSGTFTATVASGAVPDASSPLLLLGFAIVGLAGLRRLLAAQ